MPVGPIMCVVNANHPAHSTLPRSPSSVSSRPTTPIIPLSAIMQSVSSTKVVSDFPPSDPSPDSSALQTTSDSDVDPATSPSPSPPSSPASVQGTLPDIPDLNTLPIPLDVFMADLVPHPVAIYPSPDGFQVPLTPPKKPGKHPFFHFRRAYTSLQREMKLRGMATQPIQQPVLSKLLGYVWRAVLTKAQRDQFRALASENRRLYHAQLMLCVEVECLGGVIDIGKKKTEVATPKKQEESKPTKQRSVKKKTTVPAKKASLNKPKTRQQRRRANRYNPYSSSETSSRSSTSSSSMPSTPSTTGSAPLLPPSFSPDTSLEMSRACFETGTSVPADSPRFYAPTHFYPSRAPTYTQPEGFYPLVTPHQPQSNMYPVNGTLSYPGPAGIIPQRPVVQQAPYVPQLPGAAENTSLEGLMAMHTDQLWFPPIPQLPVGLSNNLTAPGAWTGTSNVTAQGQVAAPSAAGVFDMSGWEDLLRTEVDCSLDFGFPALNGGSMGAGVGYDAPYAA